METQSSDNIVSHVSIVIPAYNAAAFLSSCLESLEGQTCTGFEVVIVDDGSSDESKSVFDNCQRSNNVYKYICQTNQGPSVARNRGVKEASGEYVLFLDVDDVLHRRCIELLLHAIVDTGAPMVCTSLEIINLMRVQKWKEAKINASFSLIKSEQMIKNMLIDDSLFSQCCKLAKRDLWLAHPFRSGVWYEDAQEVYKVVDDAKSVAFSLTPLYGYIQRANSTTNKTIQLERQCRDLKNTVDECCLYLEERYQNCLSEYIKCYRLNAYAGLFIRLCINKNDADGRLIQSTQNYLRENIPFVLKSSLISKKNKLKIIISSISKSIACAAFRFKALFASK